MSQYVLDNVPARINTKYCYFAFSGNLSDAKFNNTRNYHLDRQLRMKEVKRDLRAIRYFVKTSRPSVASYRNKVVHERRAQQQARSVVEGLLFAG